MTQLLFYETKTQPSNDPNKFTVLRHLEKAALLCFSGISEKAFKNNKCEMCVCVCSFWTSLPLMSSDSQAKMKPQSASRWGKSDHGQGDVQTVVYRYKCCQWLLLALKEEHDTAELKKYSTGSEWRRMCAHLMSLQDIHVFVSLFTSHWMESLSPHSLSQCALSHRRPWGRDKLCLTGLIHSRSQTLKPEWTAAFLPSWETTEFIRLFCFFKRRLSFPTLHH